MPRSSSATTAPHFAPAPATASLAPPRTTSGFAPGLRPNASELLALGPGQHFGEWWGGGIQRGYGLKEKRFSLFNVGRWGETRPACCGVVPVIWRGPADELTAAISRALYTLQTEGSRAAPGFMRPEGIVLFHVAGGHLFKKTLEKDEPKGRPEA